MISDFVRNALVCIWGAAYITAAQNAVTIGFDVATPSADYSQYSEGGFTLTTTVGSVRINNAFVLSGNAAQPSFGFGQGLDSAFTVTSDLHRPFTLLSVDLLEATGFPQKFGVTLTGTHADATFARQTFTLDG